MAEFLETDFEDWFLKHSKLPGGDKLLFLSRQRPILRKVDMLFLNKSDFSLVLVEIKNETASIRSIGQVLEYLGQYEGLDFDSLIDEFDTRTNPLRSKISKLQPNKKKVSGERHIVIAAPSFDYPTMATAALLNERFTKAGLKISLMRIKKTRTSFKTSFVEISKPLPIRQLEGKHAINQRNRLFFVLNIKNSNLILNVGKIKGKEIVRPSQGTRTRRLVRKRNVRLLEYSGDHELDLSRQGTWWLHKNNRRRAVILGETKGKKPLVYIAFLDRTEKQGFFSIREKIKFDAFFSTPIDPPKNMDWKEVVKENVKKASGV